jgi:PmbA protein
MSMDEEWYCLSEIVRKSVKKLEKKRVTHAEAFLASSHITETGVRNSEILTQNVVEDSGVGFRVAISRNKVGFACTNNLTEKAVWDAAEKALKTAKTSSEMKSFALPEPRRLTRVKGLYDAKVSAMSVDEAVDVAMRAVEAAESFDRRVTVKDGRISFMTRWRGIVNTLGVDFEEKETKTAIGIGGSGEKDGEMTCSCFDLALSHKLDLRPEALGKNVGKMVVRMFDPKPLKSFHGTVIFGPEAVSYQLCNVLVDALKAENVEAKRSAWTTRLGETVTSENLTITDDAVLENGFASRSFDDEGCCSQRTSLVEKGELEGFLHHATSAKALGAENTGNASRFAGGFDMIHQIIGNGYRTRPEVYPSNMIIKPGTETKAELVSQLTRGVLIESMSGFAQQGSGVISAQLSRAFLVQNGEIQYPIKGGMVSGVAFDWLKHVSSVSKDPKQFPNAIVPSLLVENVRVIGA